MLKVEGKSGFRALSLLAAILAGTLLLHTSRPGFGQLIQKVQLASPATTPPMPPAIAPAPSSAASAPIKETKESKETKETKEVKDRPADWVEFTGAIAWPVCVLLIVFMLLFSKVSKRAFGIFPRIVNKVSAGGVELQINSEAVDEVRQYLRGSFDELIARAKEEYQRMASVQQISKLLGGVIDDALPRVLADNHIAHMPADVRGTIHVPDIVFSSYLYQLVNYYPTDKQAGGSANRRFSQRFGIIGRSWRLGESMGRGNAVVVGPNPTRQLIEQWGFMRNEISDTRGRPADLCVILRDEDHVPIGLLFVDSIIQDGFGTDLVASRVANELGNEPETLALARALERVMAPLRLAAPDLEITRTLQ